MFKMRHNKASSILFITLIVMPMDFSVEGQYQQSASILQGKNINHQLNNNKKCYKQMKSKKIEGSSNLLYAYC